MRVKLQVVLLPWAAMVSLASAQQVAVTSSSAAETTAESAWLGSAEDSDVPVVNEMLSGEVGVASAGKGQIRRTPAIVTLVTREQILNSGARDLIDVLRLVPGFDFHLDVQGSVGISVRGNWAQEGKVLLLLDGIPLNEMQYSTVQIAFRVPVEQIERIEIIRGPGSVLYGGNAELAVISIVTRNAANLDGLQAFGRAGLFEGAFGHALAGVQYAKIHSNGVLVRAAVSGGYANASSRDYVDAVGQQYSLVGNNVFKPWLARLGLGYAGLEIESQFELYDMYQRDGYGESLPEGPVPANFRSQAVRATYLWDVLGHLRLVPQVAIVRQIPWDSPGERARRLLLEDGYGGFSDRLSTRYSAGLRAEIYAHEYVNILVGSDYYLEDHREYEGTFTNGDTVRRFNDMSAYGQMELNWEWLSSAVGLRYEYLDAISDGALVPRGSLGIVFGPFHSKFLYSQAYRTPGLFNVDLNPAIKPETTTVYEVETGYQFSGGLALTGNGFISQIENPIVYLSDPATGTEGYINFRRTGTVGAEGQARYGFSRGYAAASYSYSRPLNNEVSLYQVGQTDKRMLGMTGHKATFDGMYHLGMGVSIDPSVVVYGRRDAINAAGDVETLGPSTLLNMFARLRMLDNEDFEIGAGVMNILDDSLPYVQPYDAGHPPLPGRAREYVVRMGYRL